MEKEKGQEAGQEEGLRRGPGPTEVGAGPGEGVAMEQKGADSSLLRDLNVVVVHPVVS